MFLGLGTFVESTEAKIKTLEHVLREYAERRFTGYIIYKNNVVAMYVAIAIFDGGIVACRCITNGVMYEGIGCSDIVAKYLHSSEGVIEVYGADRNTIVFDLMIFPFSAVEGETPLATIVGTKIGLPLVKRSLLESEKPLQASAKLDIQKPKSIQITDECIDPILLYTIIKSSQLIEFSRGALTIQNIIQRIESIVEEKKPRYIYVNVGAEEVSARIIYDGQVSKMSIEIEEKGSIKCGKEALEGLSGHSLSEVKVWIIS